MAKKRLNKKLHERGSEFCYETMEHRIAPGSTMDLLGMVTFGSLQHSLEPAVAFQQSIRTSRVTIGNLTHLEKDNINFMDPSIPSVLDTTASKSESDLKFRLDLPTIDIEPRQELSQSWQNGSNRNRSEKSSFKVHSPSASSRLSGVVGPAPERLPVGQANVNSSIVADQPMAKSPGGDDFIASLPGMAEGALLWSMASSDRLPAGEIQASQKSNEHRLPPELRGRTDDLLNGRSLSPYQVKPTNPREPSTGLLRSPAEYEPMRGVLYSYASYPSVVTDLVRELTEDPTKDDIAYVVVNSATQQTTATNSFVAAGANMSKVQFFIQPLDSVWMRDYGPHFITVDDAPAIVDSHYYPSRPLDNFIPTLVGDNNLRFPTYDMGLYFSGGNFQPGPNRSGFVTSLVNGDNPAGDGFDAGLISELHQKYLGIDTLHVMPQLPFSVDGTGHVDMWMYLVDHDTVIISEFLPGSNSTAIQITNNAVGYMQNLGFEVFRTPAWNSGSTHFTYANAFRVNNRIFVPVYGTVYKPGGNSSYNSRDDLAIQAWQAAAGAGVEIIPIQCSQIILASGAIHCIVKQVPRYTGNAPAVDIIAPAGGEILSPLDPFRVEWSAIDTNNSDPSSIEIHVAFGNRGFRHIATSSDTGSYLWTPENSLFGSEPARLKIIARSSSGSMSEVISHPFSVVSGNPLTYDFSGGAGVNKFAYGSQTASWSSINGNSFPVIAQLTSTNYARLATSNAVGGNDADTNRYIAPVPSATSNESTHLFAFQLSTAIEQMAQLEVLWEGYGDFSTQVELYIWDQVARNWGDGTGRTGVNRYMDSWAGNIDGFLTGSIRTDFSRYVDKNGLVRFLVYTDRPGAVGSTGQGIETFHDYMSVKVKEWRPERTSEA